jgi:hypothetical protein
MEKLITLTNLGKANGLSNLPVKTKRIFEPAKSPAMLLTNRKNLGCACCLITYSISILYLSRRPAIPALENFAFLILFDSGSIE